MSVSSVDRHPSDDVLELYALGQMKDFEVEELDEHLLVCGNCRERLDEVDSYVTNMKSACREIAARPVEPVAPPTLARIIRMPMPVWAGACAVLALGTAIAAFQRPPVAALQESEVTLVASRGTEGESAAAGRVRFSIETAGLPSYPAYLVTLVDSTGRQVWFTQAQAKASRISVRVPLQLAPGAYWVRVSSPNSEPAREFALHLK